jgi:hypothetical protein
MKSKSELSPKILRFLKVHNVDKLGGLAARNVRDLSALIVL